MGWVLYSFAEAANISVPERQAESLKQRHCDDALPGSVHAKAVPLFVKNRRCDSENEQIMRTGD